MFISGRSMSIKGLKNHFDWIITFLEDIKYWGNYMVRQFQYLSLLSDFFKCRELVNFFLKVI